MKLLSLFIFALLAFVKTSPPDIHSREVSSVENGRYLPQEDAIIFCNSRFIHCSEQISICENIEGISSKELYGRKTSDFVCDNKYIDDPHSGRGPPGIPTVRYIKMNIRFINCTPLTGNNKGPMIDLTDNISKYYIDGGKNYITANNKDYVCESRYGDEVMHFRRSSCSAKFGPAVCP